MRTYSARLAPVGRVGLVARMSDGKRERTRLTASTFKSQRGLVDVPLHAMHDTSAVTLGRLVLLTRDAWGWVGDVEIADGADEVLRSGQPLSVGYSVEESYMDGDVEVVVRAVLDEVSCVDVGAFDGAKLVTAYRPTAARELRNREALGRTGVLARGADDHVLDVIRRGKTPAGWYSIHDDLGGEIFYPVPS